MGRALRPRKGTTAVSMDAPKVGETGAMPRKIVEVPKVEAKKENALMSTGSGSMMTEYEMLRAMRVARNAAVLAELGVKDEMADLARDAASMKRRIAPHKGLEWQKRSKKSNEPIVMRRSLRTQGIAPSGEVSLKDDHENAGPTSPAFDERPQGDVEMRSIIAGDMDTCILSRLRALRDSDHDSLATTDVSERKHNSRIGAQNAEAHQLQLVQKDVAKVAVKNIFCISFLPTTDRLVAATGDKAGYVGLWDVDAEADADEGVVGEEAKGGHRSYDGVHVFHPHSKPVSAIQVHPNDISKVYTCSFDGSVRVTDVDRGVFEELHVDDSSDFSAMCLSPCARVAYVGDGDGDLSILDLRSKKPVSQFGLHSRKVNSVQINPQREHLVLTASTDNTAMLWDLRRWDATSAGSGVSPSKSASPKPLYVLSHSKAVNSAYFSPDGMRIGSTSYDNCVRVWDDVLSWADSSLASPRPIKTMKQPTIIKHDNQTGRWIASFRAVWSWDCRHLFIGNMNRALDVLSVSHPNQRPLSLKCDVLEAIPARLGVHPLLPVVGGGGGSRIYIWRPPK